jgi:Nuclease-related domain
LIVGPTGVFVIETKNNKETVTYDGYNWKGITKNPSNQVEVNAFRLKDLLKECEVFSKREPYVNAIVVFSNSKLKLNLSHEETLKWPKIIRIKSQSDKSLSNYITNKSIVFKTSRNRDYRAIYYNNN